MCGILLILDDELVEEKPLKALEALINKRGPDYKSSIQPNITKCGLKIKLKASVLHLRGHKMQPQPVIDDDGNILLFNGQIYKISGQDLNEDLSDTKYLSDRLRNCKSTREIADIFSAIDGPFSFIYWHNGLSSLVYGRDLFGRKSLCSLQNNQTSYPIAISSLASDDLIPKEVGVTWFEIDCTSFHCIEFISNEVCKKTKFLWNIDEIYPPTSRCQIPPKDSKTEYIYMQAKPLKPLNKNLKLYEEFMDEDREIALTGLEQVLVEAVRKRIKFNRKACLECRKKSIEQDCDHSKVVVAFSGGIDSTLLALALDKVLGPQETIDLTTVAFKDESPDRASVGNAYKELRRISPTRNWRLILCDISKDALQAERQQVIRNLIYPCNTVVDDSLGCGCWFISRAQGRILNSMIDDSKFDRVFERFLKFNPSDNSTFEVYTSPATMFFAGMSIDEQLGGYSSHRAAWSNSGTSGLYEEICKQMRRLSYRNLGRDDRCCSHHGRDVKFPYLDYDLISYLNSLPIGLKMNLAQPMDIGPKRILRELAFRWGLHETGRRVKRALQFGTRIANLENTKEQGNQICARLIQSGN